MSKTLEQAIKGLRKSELVHLVAWAIGEERVADGLAAQHRAGDCGDCRFIMLKLSSWRDIVQDAKERVTTC